MFGMGVWHVFFLQIHKCVISLVIAELHSTKRLTVSHLSFADFTTHDEAYTVTLHDSVQRFSQPTVNGPVRAVGQYIME